MKYRTLGRSALKVSELCLGSMTWGNQNTEAEGHDQIDRAVARGVNFIDTAEMYPTNPVSREKAGMSEEVIGNWLASRGGRDRVILATKVCGPGQRAVRDGGPITPATIRTAIEGSLRRMRTDYIDLYQLHWPNRGSYMFRQNWTYDPFKQNRVAVREHMDEVMGELASQVQAGRIRAFGLSNESAWGTMAWNAAAERAGGPRVISVQNEYSLLCRFYDTDMAEMSYHEDVGLLAFSPMGAGLLSGKYGPDHVPEGSRRSFTPDLGGRISPRVWPAIDAYLQIARDHGLDPAQMALAFVLTRPFLGSAIFGATSTRQLELALAAPDLELAPEVMTALAAAHKAHPMPY